MSRRKSKPTDPAEIARRRRERDRSTRSDPTQWGANEDALSLPANATVSDTPATRTTVRSLRRFSCFETLKMHDDKDMAALVRYTVSRLEELIAARFRVDGANGAGTVQASGSAEQREFRSIMAGEQIDAIFGWMQPWQAKLINALVHPMIVEGKPVNWKAIVKQRMALTDRDMQARAVKQAAQALVEPFARWDAGERPERRVAA